jgi:hypothetical protein
MCSYVSKKRYQNGHKLVLWFPYEILIHYIILIANRANGAKDISCVWQISIVGKCNKIPKINSF